MAVKIKNQGIYAALVNQLDKLARHNRQGSFRTRERYYDACKRFCAHLADEYHLQKLENINGKHLTSCVLSFEDLHLTLKVEDLMPILGIGRNTAYELIRCGKIRSIRIGKQLRIPKQALIDYLSDAD